MWNFESSTLRLYYELASHHGVFAFWTLRVYDSNKSVLVAANDNSMIKTSKVNIETYIAEILGGVPSQLDNFGLNLVHTTTVWNSTSIQYNCITKVRFLFSDQIGFGTFNVETRKWWLYVLHSSMIWWKWFIDIVKMSEPCAEDDLMMIA